MMRGLCGWLAPDGKFTVCRYTQHVSKADEIVEKLDIEAKTNLRLETGWFIPNDDLLFYMGYIKVGSPDLIRTFGDSYVFFPIVKKVPASVSHLYTENGLYILTESQIKWFNKNIANLNNTQLEQIVSCRYVRGIDKINFNV